MRRSAGILMYRQVSEPEVLLVHPGGPFWRNKDRGAWSIPKGEYGPDEEAEAAAIREFQEELGVSLSGSLLPLGDVTQAGGKQVTAFAVRGDFDPALLKSATFTMEWPPRSGRAMVFPEVDRAAWFPLETARTRIIEGQCPFLDRLERLLLGPAAR